MAANFSLNTCYATAWKAFGKWWIPLCLISGVLFVFQIIPQITVKAEKSALMQNAELLVDAVAKNDWAAAEPLIMKVHAQSVAMTLKVLKLAVYLAPVVTLFSILLLVFSNAAVKDHRKQILFGRVLYLAGAHLVVALLKAAAFLLFILPGVYLYVRLFFVSMIMIEEEASLGEAMKRSWAISRGHFGDLFLLLIANVAIQLAAAITIIGLVPATGFANTARAAAYHTLKSPSV